MRRVILGTAALLLALAMASGATRAAGGSLAAPRNQDLVAGAALIEAGRYSEAIPLMHKVVAVEPSNADAYNYLGFSHRKLGDKAKALEFYQMALTLKPKHRGANEYLGELYLEMGDLARAEKRLDVLDSACWFGCEEYSDLKQAIEAFKAKQGG